MTISRLKSLFEASDEGVQALAAEIQSAPEGLTQIPGSEWLDLLRIEGKPAAQVALCAIAAEHMPPTRLTLEQCVELACSESIPLAHLGLKIAQLKPLPGSPAVLLATRLAHAPVADVRQDGVRWVIQILERSPHSKLEHLRELLCAPYEDARRRGAAAMTRSLRFKDSMELWITLARSPHSDVRAFLLLHLTRRKSGLPAGSLKHLWATTMIALAHVRGEVKRAVIERLFQYARAHPEDAEALVPLYEIAGVSPLRPKAARRSGPAPGRAPGDRRAHCGEPARAVGSAPESMYAPRAMSSNAKPSLRAAASIAALAGALASPSLALASPELHVEGRHFKDAAGAVVVLRGVNVAGDSKVPPFRPASDPAIFDPLAGWGLNVVRLLFTWEAYEPSPGAYDQSYLDYYTAAARAAWERGLFVIVDFHQDAFSRSSLGGCGDGFPAWTIPPSITQHAPDNGPSCSDWGPRMLKDKDMAASWDAFYADSAGARTRYLAMITSVAARLDAEPGVIGYDVLNEPWGDEITQIGPLHQDAAAAIRAASPTAIVFLEPRALASSGNSTALVDPKIPGSAYAPHFYDPSVLLIKSWSNLPPDEPWSHMLGPAEAWGVPLLLGEIGAPAGTAQVDGYMSALYSRLDESFASATQWVYTPGWTEAAKDGWNTEDLSIVDDKGRLRDNFRPRPYARRVAGEPVRALVTADAAPAARSIELEWIHAPSAGSTEIFAPIDAYFGGAGAVIEATGDGLACSLAASLITCSSPKPGPMKVVVRARPPAPAATDSGACGLTGIEILFLLPLYAASRARRRRSGLDARACLGSSRPV